MRRIKKWWEKLSPTRKQQLYCIAGVTILLGIGFFILCEIIRELKSILPVLALIPLFFWENISNFFQQERNRQIEQKKQRAVQIDAVYKEVGSFVVLPVIHIIWNIKLDVDSLYYFGSLAYGDGFYYQLPSVCESKTDKLNLQRKVERKLAAYLQCPFADVARKKIVSIYGDVLVIRIS